MELVEYMEVEELQLECDQEGHKDLYKLSHFGSPVDSGNLCRPTVYNSGWLWGINGLVVVSCCFISSFDFEVVVLGMLELI